MEFAVCMAKTCVFIYFYSILQFVIVVFVAVDKHCNPNSLEALAPGLGGALAVKVIVSALHTASLVLRGISSEAVRAVEVEAEAV